MREWDRSRLIIFAVVVVAVAGIAAAIWFVPTTAPVPWTGIEIVNTSQAAMGFDIFTNLRSGHLDVAANTWGTFVVATGTNLPRSYYYLSVSSSTRGILWRGAVWPNADCWAPFGWNGTALAPLPINPC